MGGAGEDESRGEERECEESFAHGGIPFSDWGEVRVRSLLGGVKWIYVGREGLSFARMPTHAMRLHEWGTQGLIRFHVWATRRWIWSPRGGP